MLTLALLAACTPRDPTTDDSDTGVAETDVTDTDETDPPDTDETDLPDTDETDPIDTDDTDDDTDVVPCAPAPAHTTRFEVGVLLESAGTAPGITNITAADLLGTGTTELIVSDAWGDAVIWLGRCDSAGDCESRSLPGTWVDPTRSAVADVDGDGFRDVVVADIGDIFPTDDRVGSVRVLWGRADHGFVEEVLVENIGRTSCVQAADMDGDADVDLVVCEFGNTEGSLFWLEQTSTGWTRHALYDGPGAVDAWVGDVTLDGHVDVVSGIAQTEEVVAVFVSRGDATFFQADAFRAGVDWFGTSGTQLVDMDYDGDLDVVLTNGDTLDVDLPFETRPEDHYGVAWLENRRTRGWRHHDVLRHWGAYTTRPIDIDQDCDIDIVVAALQFADVYQDRELPDPEPLFWLERGDDGSFTKHTLAGAAGTTLFALEVADVDGDGHDDVVTGLFDIKQDQTEAARLQWWRAIWE